MTKRRSFLKGAVATGLMTLAPRLRAEEVDIAGWAKTWATALDVLDRNIKPVPNFDQPVLYEGAVYRGTWMECGPHESLAYAQLADHVKPAPGRPTPLEVARNTHRAFFVNQRPDGQIPANVHVIGLGFAQIQMVVPIAATAWDLSRLLKDEAFLLEAYTACSRWDAWLRKYRDTRGTGLVEAFCAFDTGQDNSPRWEGVSDACPDKDARKFTPGQSVPRLCPDLSATVFGARVALAEMATALGKPAEARRWRADAEHIRTQIIERLWCAEDASFYDVGPDGKFVRIRSVANMRVLGEHVLRLDVARERRMFEQLWTRQLHNPAAYWTKYPFPSIAVNDPAFVRPLRYNSWGGPSQALTALRTLRWMDHYGQDAAQKVLMERWCEAILRDGFYQQIDPDTGVFTKMDMKGGPAPAFNSYSPAALTFLHFAKRLGHAPA
ncbi:MAG TPA: alpha-L-rhamnosidase [Sphingobium sp.]|uniref:MGH1-like glycoside hydrolase domain-containing protein n=1 Tax=Sphingobium sp. TaxID=1912891 RepID=UPI002ED413ED